MKETDTSKLLCPVEYTLHILNGKWKLSVVWQLVGQKCIRFNELQRHLDGISTVVLKRTLQELQEYEIVHREQYNEVPPKVEYSLTTLGYGLLPVFKAMVEWATKNNPDQFSSKRINEIRNMFKIDNNFQASKLD
jgi:DNA-binding HxlR family transcriptional regulator